MEKNLAVPYKSQHDSDSVRSNNDCGPASLAMVLEFFGRKTTVGEVLEKLGNPTGYTSFPQLTKVAQDLGFNVGSKVDATFQELKKYIDLGVPVIVVGGYGYLNSTQEKADNGDKAFKGSHIMVICGYRDDDSVYANDPDFWGKRVKEGDHHVYTGPEFFTFWRNEGNQDGNKPNTLFVVTPTKAKVEEVIDKNTPKKVVVTSDLSLNGRSKPELVKENVIKSFPKNTELEVVKKVAGQDVKGNAVWYLVKNPGTNDQLFIWSGAVEPVKVEESKKEEPKPELPKDPGAKISELPSNSEPSFPPQGQVADSIEAMKMVYTVSRQFLIANNALPTDEVVKVSWLQKLKELLRIK